jgi:hypothetical protein
MQWLHNLQWKVNAPKKRLPHVFRNPLCPIPNLTTSLSFPGARDPIFSVTPFNQPRKKDAKMQKSNVSHGKKGWTRV